MEKCPNLSLPANQALIQKYGTVAFFKQWMASEEDFELSNADVQDFINELKFDSGLIEGFTGPQQQTIVKYFTATIIQNRKEGFSSRDLLTELFNDFKEEYEELVKENSIDEAIDIKRIIDNQAMFELLITQKLHQISEKGIDEDNFDQDEKGKEKNHNKEAYEEDPFLSTSPRLRKLFFMVRDVDENFVQKTGYVGIPLYKEASEIIPKLQIIASTLTHEERTNTDLLKAALENKVSIMPWLRPTIDLLNESGERYWIEFAKFISKHEINMTTSLVDNRGKSVKLKAIDTNQNSIAREIVQSWLASQVVLPIVKEVDGNMVIDNNVRNLLIAEYEDIIKNPTPEALAAWLSQIGITLHPKVLTYIVENSKEDSKYFENMNFISLVKDKKGWFNRMYQALVKSEGDSENKLSLNNPLFNNIGVKKLADLQARFDPDATSTSFVNGENKTISTFSNNKYASIQFARLQNPDYAQSMLESPFAANSWYLQMLAENNAEFKEVFSFEYADTLKIQNSTQDNKSLDQCTDAEYELFRLTQFANNKFLFPTMSDKKATFIMKTLTKKVNIVFNGNQFELSKDIVEEVFKTIESELDRNSVNYQNGVSGNQYIFNYPELNTTDPENPNFIPGLFSEENGRLITNDTEEVRASLLKWLNGKLKSEINNQVAEWKKLNIITENNEFKFMDADYLKKMGSHITNDTQKNIQVAADYVLNYYIFKHNMFQSFITDPLFYFKGNIEETWINIGKRLASENAPGYDLINVGKSEYRQAFAADPKMVSYSLDYYKKLGLSDDKIKDYSTIDGTDAQEYTTLQEHLYVMYHTGKLNEEDYKNLLNKANTPIKDGKPNDFTSEELGILQAMKPVYRETIIKNRLNRPIYIKTSSFPLIPQLTRGLEINNLRVAMEKGKVDRFVFKSGAKVGFPSKLTNVFGSDGEFLSDIEFLEDSIISLPRSGFRIQQEVPYNKDKQFVNTVTQADKLIVADLPARLEPTKQKYFELKKQIYQIHYDELVKELNLKETVDGYTYDIEKLSKLLIREGEARNYSTNDLKSLEIKNGKFVVPLLFNNSGLKVQSALMSIVDKKVRKLKMPGFSGILASEAGFKTQKDYKDLTAEQKSDIVFIDSKHDGLSHDEVLVPFKFRDDNGVLLNVKDFVKEDGTLDTSRVPKELLRLLGFRIPNQGKNSMLSIKIAGFLPSYMGDLIVASRDLTKQMGSDFDVDKLYVYMYNTKYDPSTKTISKYTIGDTVLVDENQEVDEIEEGDEDEIRNKKKTKGGREYEVQNEIIDIYHEILNDPEIMVQIKTPLGFGKLHDIKKKILAIKPKEELSPLSPKYDRKKYISARGGKAGTGVFSASNTLNAVIQDRGMYTTTIEVDEEGKAKKVEQILYLTEKSTRLSEREDVNGNLKSSTHSAFQSASVDEEKEQLLSSLNVNTYTFDFITGATQSGFDEEAICYLINQPVINEFINEVGNRTSVLSDVFDKNAEENVIYELIDKYTALAEEEYKSNSIVSLTDLENALSGDITVKNYYSTQLKAINKFAEFKEVGKNLKQLTSTISADSKGLSKDVISLVYKIDQVRNLSKMGGLMNAEKALGTFHKTQVEGSVRLDDGLYLVPETIPGMAVAYGSFTAYNMYKNLLPYEGADFKTTIDWISKLSGRQLDTPTKLVDFTTKLSDVMRMYYFSSQDLGIYKEDVMLLRNRLLLGDDSLARRIAALQPTTTNKFIRRLFPVINTEADGISVLKFNAATRETMDEPEIHRAFAQLFIDENTRSLAEDIVSYAYLTGGVQMAVQYIKFIPFSYIKYSGMVSKLYDINSKLMYISTIPSQDTVFDNGAYPFVPNEVTQLLQSNPDYSYRIKDYKTLKNTNKIDGKLISFDVPKEALYATGELKGFPIEIVSVRQKDKTLALFQYDANTQKYNRIDNLGTFPIQEFNANGKGKSIVKNNITPVGPVSPITSQTYTPKPSIPLSNPYAGVNFLESMGLADDSTLSEQALDYIIEGADGYYSTLAKVLKENFDKLQGITIKLDNNLKARASWNYETRVVKINPEKIKNDEERFKGTVIEELFHALTAEILREPKTELQKKLVSSITSLMNFVEKKVREKYKEEAEKGIAKSKKNEPLSIREFGLFYGLKNEREFVAQAFRNREFQKLLNGIDYGTEGKTLLDKFISLVKEALKSIGIDIKEGTALDAAVNQMFKLLEDEKIKPIGKEISSNSKGLLGALTNPTELAKSKGNIAQSYPVEFRGKTYADAEAAYQALKSTATKDDGPNSTYNLMVDIIKAKLEQHPRLVSEITKLGGSEWILSSTHQPTKQNTVWETGGKNWFIKALNDAYKKTISKSTNEINFQEESSSNYAERTKKNASADATIAIAVDFNSAGEKLTKSSVLSQNKKYIPVDANKLEVTKERVDKIVEMLNSVNAKTLNIAGNGIYTMKGKYIQQQVDDFTYDLLNQVINSPNLKTKIESIRSGGQTGFDEAGAKAGIKLGLPTLVLAPKGWKFRNIEKQDISNEQEFKARFNQTLQFKTENTNIKVIPLDKSQRFTRESVKKDTDYIYLFTDNAARTSGNNLVDPNSWYADAYGKNSKFPTKTQAVIRGLNNAFPITTMIDDKGTQWTDDKFNEFTKEINHEIRQIQESILDEGFKGIKFSAEMPFGKGAISNMKETAPKIWNYLNEKLKEIGIDNTSDKPKAEEELKTINYPKGTVFLEDDGTYTVLHNEEGVLGEYLTKEEALQIAEKYLKDDTSIVVKTISSPIYKDAYGNFYKFDLLESDPKEMVKGYYSQGSMNDWKEMSNKTANNKFYDEFDELIEVVDKPEISVLSNEVNINGISINTGNIILNEQQLSSLQNIANFIDSLIKQGTWETTTFSLQGYAGTGKTTITRFIVQYLKKKGKNYTLSSPTHRAKEVLQDLTGEKAMTVAKLLGLAPGVDVENFNLVDKQFQSQYEIKIPKNGIVIVDEASMVNDQLFDSLVELAAERGSKVLFIGDEAQLKPVKQKEKGKAFRRTSNITKLTQVMRTANGNPMPAEVLLPIRDNPTSKVDMFEHDDKLSPTGEGIKFVNNAKEWMASLLDKVSIENLTENPNLVRALAYTNKRVRELNTFIRAKMFGIGAEDFYKGELLMMYENLFWLPGGDYVYPNGMDVTIENVQYVSDFKINVPEKNRQVSVAGFMITTSKTKNKQKNIKDLFIADLDRVSSEYIKELVELKNKILNTPFAQRGPMWNKFYEFSDAYNLTDEVYFINDVAYSSRNEALKIARQLYPSMNQNQLDKIVNNSKAKDKSVDYAYAHTIHKSQGGTYDYSYVDEGNIDMARQFPNPDYEMINQLKYVGFSRSSKLTVSLTQKTQNTEIKTSPSQATLPSEEELREGIKKCSL